VGGLERATIVESCLAHEQRRDLWGTWSLETHLAHVPANLVALWSYEPTRDSPCRQERALEETSPLVQPTSNLVDLNAHPARVLAMIPDLAKWFWSAQVTKLGRLHLEVRAYSTTAIGLLELDLVRAMSAVMEAVTAKRTAMVAH